MRTVSTEKMLRIVRDMWLARLAESFIFRTAWKEGIALTVDQETVGRAYYRNLDRKFEKAARITIARTV